jgi:hypothetical protein
MFELRSRQPLECSDQNRADENEHGTQRKHFGFQGKVHVAPPLLMGLQASTEHSQPEAGCAPRR